MDTQDMQYTKAECTAWRQLAALAGSRTRVYSLEGYHDTVTPLAPLEKWIQGLCFEEMIVIFAEAWPCPLRGQGDRLFG